MASEREDDLEKAAASLRASSQHWIDFMARMSDYQRHVTLVNLKAAEELREPLHVLLDDYLDQFAIAGKLALGGKDKKK